MVQEHIVIRDKVHIKMSELVFSAIRAQGAGGQHVNKVSTAIHLKFDVLHSGIPQHYKEKVMAYSDHRITKEGVIIIKSQESRSQDQNKQQAIEKLVQLIKQATHVDKVRRATKPTKASVKRRLTAKTNRKQLKQSRQKVKY